MKLDKELLGVIRGSDRAASLAFLFFFCFVSLGGCARHRSPEKPESLASPASNSSPDAFDAALEQAATEALKGYEGACVVMDPQTGRIRAVVNPRLAFEQTFPPGSTIKAFTALTALKSGLIDSETRSQCRQKFSRPGFEIVCSHPRSDSPFSLSQAIAYSCNYYFATLGERLGEDAFNTTLASFGFGERTGINASSESPGTLKRGVMTVKDPLGEGDHLLVTPIQLITAYAAVINGGRLFRPRLAGSAGFASEIRTTIHVADWQRALIVEGMQGAVRYGTAARARLTNLPIHAFGKTGTSASSNGFRTNGWFVGFAIDPVFGSDPEPDAVSLAVLVFLKNGRGSDCAEVSRRIFEEYAMQSAEAAPARHAAVPSATSDHKIDLHEYGPGATGYSLANLNFAHSAVYSEPLIKVRMIREGTTRIIGLEDYVVGNLVAESSLETAPEALKAQAVVSRTYALKNRGRHAADGYDYCSLTHCQLYADPARARISAQRRAVFDQAVKDTANVVLRDAAGNPADAYFSASCGGFTANIKSLWGVEAPQYLRGVRDDYCTGELNGAWTDTIPAARLARALSRDSRTDIGPSIESIAILKRDRTGRVEEIALEGARRKIVGGWEFKIIVGRALGWNILKSSKFNITRSGNNFVFHGSGFGHGLGLCQAGAHVMALRGAPYQRILEHYFPGVTIGGSVRNSRAGPMNVTHASYEQLNSEALDKRFQNRSRSLSSEHFRILYPSTTIRSEVESALRILERAWSEMQTRLLEAGLADTTPAAVTVVVHGTTGDFVSATGEPAWAAGATRGNNIQLQPLALLHRRGVLTQSLFHEYAHVVIENLSKGDCPRWLAEGAAALFAGETKLLAQYKPKRPLDVKEIDSRLKSATNETEARMLYAAAFEAVLKIVRADGEAALWRKVRATKSAAASPPESRYFQLSMICHDAAFRRVPLV